MLIEIIFGLVLAILLFRIGAFFFPKTHLSKWCNGLIIAAIIYVIFALTEKNLAWICIEILGVFIYSIPAILSKRYSAYWLALGWALHVLWDLLLHQNGHPGFVPHWYPGICLGFDLALAGAIIHWIRKNRVQNESPIVK